MSPTPPCRSWLGSTPCWRRASACWSRSIVSGRCCSTSWALSPWPCWLRKSTTWLFWICMGSVLPAGLGRKRARHPGYVPADPRGRAAAPQGVGQAAGVDADGDADVDGDVDGGVDVAVVGAGPAGS